MSTDRAVLMAFADRGRLHFDEQGRVAGFLARFQGERLRVTIEKPPTLRSLAQNRKLWAVYKDGCLGMADLSGHTKDEVHEGLKELYCPEKPINLAGQAVMVKSTKLLTKPEMSDYLEQCMAFFAKHGVEIHTEGAA